MDILVENISKKFGNQVALNNISFNIKKGEIVGFLGPNGAGKTTTMKIITSILKPTNGDVKIGGISVVKHPDKIKKYIGYLPENNPLYQDMGVVDYLKFCAQIQGISKNEINFSIKDIIKKCGLNSEKHKHISELSKGFKQRVGLAQAMINNPEVLILDEPTTGLDPIQIIEIRNLIKEIGKEKTILLSSHILSEIEVTCDRIIIINKGTIVADTTTEEIHNRTNGNYLIKVRIEHFSSSEIKTHLSLIPNVVNVIEDNDSPNVFIIKSNTDLETKRNIYNLCVSNGWILTDLTSISNTLEDVFKELTLEK